MRNLIYYVASTLDGFIAHEDGSLDGFVWDNEVVKDFYDSYEWFDTVLMGRKTYEVGLKEGKTSPYPSMKQYVFSRSIIASPDPAVEMISKDAVELVNRIKHKDGKDIWLCGGSELASTLFRNGLIDRLILKLNPVVFGTGIPIFSESVEPTAFKLTDQHAYDCGIVRLHYELRDNE